MPSPATSAFPLPDPAGADSNQPVSPGDATPLRRCVVEAPAKVNLTLELLGTRPDGYHELRSVLLPVSLRERVEVALREDGLVTCGTTPEGIPPFDMASVPPGANLAEKAARALRERTGCALGADIRIRKRVPVGAGLGGGSADAAGALHALNRLWGLGLDARELAEAGATFASDVPALALGGAVMMEGRGERVRRLAIPESAPPLWLVLAFCGEPISTRDVYGACPDVAEAPEGAAEAMAEAVARGDAEAAARRAFNGLQATVYAHHPRTASIARALSGAGALATLLSGSGGTVFGIARDENHAHAIAAELPVGLWRAVVRGIADFGLLAI